MTRIFKLSFIISILVIGISCGGKDCSLIDGSFENYKNALQVIKSSDFEFSDNCNTSKSSWIYDAEYYSCDGKTGYLIIETKSKNYIHSGVPIGMWNEFKKADSFGKYYNRNIKGRFRLTL
ncbi:MULTISPECIES: KTSC domain-containing protein [Maribacter]|uniref:KTSC domain-containing protein n=1 Tax=Maribacter flavus TaxID=1658664 RepID=A0ABU7IN95_9FLAO|nr:MULTISPECIES: KTSC domain-containing protein [Maribacter]MDC6407142.1 KTSC domain-containing protein [Maribacter sp. PR66]MEE1974291.1 KTSC domain-containing protein [Maribacter flavus]